MPDDEVDLLSIIRGAVTAPAGCGKTQLIASALSRHSGDKPVLVLTHTNAGVAALRGRLDRAGVPARAYRIATIDGWAMRLISTFPLRSAHDPGILDLQNPGSDYPAIREAAATLLQAGHINDVLRASYDRLLVDEHQDCSVVQHAMVCHASEILPTCVLGDPMQAIFGFQGNELANWDEHVCAHFPLVATLTTPWRWRKAGTEPFGYWLLDVRGMLVAGTPIDLRSAPAEVSWVELDGTDDHGKRLRAAMTPAPAEGDCVLVIGDSRRPASQREIAGQTPGAVTVENVDLRDLITFARELDLSKADAFNRVIAFASSVMVNVGAADLQRRMDVLSRGTARSEATEVERCALAFIAAPSLKRVADLLALIGDQSGVRAHRPAVLRACMKALQTCDGDDPGGFHEAAVRVREQNRIIGRPLAKRVVGSTLLLKGLEAEVAVILNAPELDAQNLYVAMTRGSKALVVCSPSPILSPPR